MSVFFQAQGFFYNLWHSVDDCLSNLNVEANGHNQIELLHVLFNCFSILHLKKLKCSIQSIHCTLQSKPKILKVFNEI